MFHLLLSIISYTIFVSQATSSPFKCWTEKAQLSPNVCAILFADEDCDSSSYNVPETHGRTVQIPWQKRNSFESLIVNKGCILQVFKDELCMEDSYIFSAPDKHEYLVIKELEDTNASDYGNILRVIRILKYILHLFRRRH